MRAGRARVRGGLSKLHLSTHTCNIGNAQLTFTSSVESIDGQAH